MPQFSTNAGDKTGVQNIDVVITDGQAKGVSKIYVRGTGDLHPKAAKKNLPPYGLPKKDWFPLRDLENKRGSPPYDGWPQRT